MDFYTCHFGLRLLESQTNYSQWNLRVKCSLGKIYLNMSPVRGRCVHWGISVSMSLITILFQAQCQWNQYSCGWQYLPKWCQPRLRFSIFTLDWLQFPIPQIRYVHIFKSTITSYYTYLRIILSHTRTYTIWTYETIALKPSQKDLSMGWTNWKSSVWKQTKYSNYQRILGFLYKIYDSW